MKENEVFAIETFPTTGNGAIFNDKECNHFMIEYKHNSVIDKATKKNNYLKHIYDLRKTLAFCPRWFDFEIPDSCYITKYPVLKTSDGGIVAQYEKTIYIKSNGIDIIN